MKTRRVIALEEHVMFEQFTKTIDPALRSARGYTQGGAQAKQAELNDVNGKRLSAMDTAGITLQVLSVVGPGADLLPPQTAPAFARAYNDALAATVRAQPQRYAAFAHLPLTAPAEAAAELQRAVGELGFRGALINGLTGGKFLDDPQYPAKC